MLPQDIQGIQTSARISSSVVPCFCPCIALHAFPPHNPASPAIAEGKHLSASDELDDKRAFQVVSLDQTHE